MEPIGNALIPESPQSWNARGQYPGPQQYGGPAAAFGDDRFTPSSASSPFGEPYSGGAYGGGSATGSSVFSQFLNFTQNVFSELSSLMQQLMGQNSSGQTPGSAASGGQQPAGPQQYFNNASLGSVGDPHDSFNGTTGSGQSVNGKWDNMKSHDRLITSDSIPGGFTVSTTATTPNASGVAYNQNATITTNNGNTVISMGASGAPSVTDNGQSVSLTAGQPATLSNGETVTLNSDGSLNVGVSNGQGGTINTTLKSNGQGVDVSATANNVDLGGYLADKQDGVAPGHGGHGGDPDEWREHGGGNTFFQPYAQPGPAFQSYLPQPYQPYGQQYGSGQFTEIDNAQILEA
jgi:hypothetical protein